MFPGDDDYGRLLDDIASCMSARDGVAPGEMLDRLQRLRRRILDYRKRYDELPYERRACLKAAVTTIDHACVELGRLKRLPEMIR